MQDRTINNALQAVHKAGGPQGELARELLRLRGVEPVRVRPRGCEPFRHGQTRAAILEALAGGPQTGPDIVRHVMQYRPSLTYVQVRGRVSTALTKMKRDGVVVKGDGVWDLV